ncbi:hypothetical protein MPTK1_2g09300 [Marchantia polymorpha subsp. ruderalis]|uniref:Mitochondrial import inner membrane translocase subunit TIM50 n=1 Tax=Marchantia polymorpha TaxID=3197 RepID=A0A2R6W436_MARPO|nr:hypothetical protein MARPO_0158s0001 [Marchantia polymorpha]BBN01666.1 hypothetical protein Mp_2g09300 [Marchantia polymorpha subsp. ruderalis]|eukprot:PTQ28618.1 hypothetical protein MARPO_0158s0001 [Marchantia polymorpha]
MSKRSGSYVIEVFEFTGGTNRVKSEQPQERRLSQSWEMTRIEEHQESGPGRSASVGSTRASSPGEQGTIDTPSTYDSDGQVEEDRPPPPAYITLPVSPLKRRLVILDMNGLLCHINHNKWFRTNNVVPHGKLGAHKSWVARPHLCEFLREVTQVVDLAIWTSRTESNLARLLQQMSAYLPENFSETIWQLLDQSYCYPLPQADANYPLWLKPLNIIEEMSDHKVANCLLVDDSPLKNAMNHPHNAIHPPTFSPLKQDDDYLSTYLLPFLKKFARSPQPVTHFVRSNWPESSDVFRLLANYWGKNLPSILFSQVRDQAEVEKLRQQVLAEGDMAAAAAAEL